MPEVAWACLTCAASGTTTGKETGADAKHVRTTGHATTTGRAAEAIAARAEHGPCTHRPPSPGPGYRIGDDGCRHGAAAQAAAARLAGGES